MASRAVLRDQPPRGEGLKQKNVAADGRNRKVLRDIGNLRNAPLDQIGRPTTRGFCAQDKIKKPVVAAQKKAAAVKPSPARSIIVISSDEEDEEEVEILSGNKKEKKKTGKTFSSTLTARSKAACGITKKQQNEQILEIDAADSGNELAVLDYVEDIYKFYKLSEDEGRVGDYMAAQPEINAKMRAILVDWMVEVHRKFELMPETFYLTVNLIDRFLSMKTVSRKELQLVGISAMLIACKYEEIWAPEVNDFIMISDNAYVRAQVLAMEKTILGKLEWYLTVPTPYVFLVRYIKAAAGGGADDGKEVENMSFFLAELGVMSYSAVKYGPSMLAASAVYVARCTLNAAAAPRWTETLRHHTGFSEEEIADCAKMLVGFHAGAAENKLKAVYRKFSSPDRGAVALFPPAAALLPPPTAAAITC
ncbi:PREDICTED: G2/mitotic-specific cyclin S13-7-like isoform X2 [Ipomoea nil]|uniref:G2/mitotic-specific cyclin S13-7-like isoform X2 n=1 Tax=Ipomoea nil TaxID=35883 RepID=UPI000900A6B8|nr:PREDICTED: G2/mitotic-specific cyclin S13-7-like isoform X2 [Ipomoea nil]